MPIISRTGRRSFKARTLIVMIHALLILGSLAMLYPFALMISASSKSAVDAAEVHIIPPFLIDDKRLYQKYVEGAFNESLEAMNIAYQSEFASFNTVNPPDEPNKRLVADWHAFIAEARLPRTYWTGESLSAPLSRGVLPYHARQFKNELIKKFRGDIALMNRTLNSNYASWNAFYLNTEDLLQRRNQPNSRPYDIELQKFKEFLPIESRYYFSPEGFFKTSFLKTQYTKDIEAYNKAHRTQYKSWNEIRLDRRFPAGRGRTDQERKDWETFVRTLLNLLWIRADREATPIFEQFLKAKYGNIASLNRLYKTNYASFEEVPIVGKPPERGIALSDWDAFLQGWHDPDTRKEFKLPSERIQIHSVDFLFRDYLKHKYGSIQRANEALGTGCKDWVEFRPPQRDLHYLAFLEKRGQWRKEFLIRNFISVFDYIVLHGQGIRNTVIYCFCAIMTALIVNPLAAYALSRYRPPFSYKVLLFLMMTMAFPPMVTQIPAFLMLRELNLLNTFWALILPGIANGYSIFLLKGFFDSLPHELFESADLDGAGELRIFWQLTMSLSTPILAVIALGAFTYAYSNFTMALLICQDEKMWTLMPWLYQLQQRSGEGVVMASLLIAAIPTLTVFALCQNVIMRGIVVPVEK